MNAGQFLHLAQVSASMAIAFQLVADSFSEDQDELYVVGVNVDGQFVKTTIGYSNIRDYVVEVDSDDLSIVSHDVPVPIS